jgi:hypothetical protein
MRTYIVWFLLLTLSVWASTSAHAAVAAQKSSSKKELATLRRDLTKAGTMIRRKKFEEAEEFLNEIEQRLDQLIADGKLSEKERAVTVLRNNILQRKSDLEAKKLAGKKISFTNDVGPIFKERCFSCHAERPKGGLRLDTFAGLQKGGASRTPLVAPRNPQRSLLMGRLMAGAEKRMPKDGERLPAVEIETIAAWIKQGAKFDGEDRNALVGEKKKPPAVIVKATGNETVSFTKDIMPFMVNICMRCHSGRNPRSEFSLETFEKLMQGGESGVLVIGGDLDGSRMWDLVGKQDPIKMPAGQAVITRTNWNNLRTWIEEGAKFDGKDPKLPLRQLVPTTEDKKTEQLAMLTPEEFITLRKDRNVELWKRVLSKEKPLSIESDEFIVFGNVSQTRLKMIGKWADAQARALRKLFNDKGSRLFKGKLTIFVMKDRYSYEEFNHVIYLRETPKEMTGHSVVDSSFEDAYVVLQNVENRAEEEADVMKITLIDHLTGAFLKRSGKKLPDWVLRGTGLAMAAKAAPKNPYFKIIRSDASGMFGSITKPEQIFVDGTFSPSEVGPVGFSLVDFLIRGGGGPKFGRFIRALQNNEGDVAAAIKKVYSTNATLLASQFLTTLPSQK